MEQVSTYTNPNGKTVYRFEGKAESLRDAMALIPGDFKVYWWNQDRDTFAIEIVRTF